MLAIVSFVRSSDRSKDSEKTTDRSHTRHSHIRQISHLRQISHQTDLTRDTLCVRADRSYEVGSISYTRKGRTSITCIHSSVYSISHRTDIFILLRGHAYLVARTAASRPAVTANSGESSAASPGGPDLRGPADAMRASCARAECGLALVAPVPPPAVAAPPAPPS
jgi:hypothetical protein